MAFHKHGIYSFQVGVQRMVVVGGNNFVADITALRRHGLSGAAEIVDLPIIDEQYGETAREAEGLAVKAMGEWIDSNLSLLEKKPLSVMCPTAGNGGRKHLQTRQAVRQAGDAG